MAKYRMHLLGLQISKLNRILIFLIILAILANFIWFKAQIESADLNNDGNSEVYILKNSRLKISENNSIIWESPKEWKIDSYVLADSTNDGIIDLNLSVWKPGDYGSSMPFWVKENDMSVKNHFFVLDYTTKGIWPIWQSSNLERKNIKFDIKDINNDDENELLVLETDYGNIFPCLNSYQAIWKWNGWGFSNEWSSEKGNFCNLQN